MGYINAKTVIPNSLVKELQKYVQGDYLYVPTDKETRRNWGSRTGAKEATAARNMQIIKEFREGCAIEELAENYYLSVHTIRKIVYTK